MFEPCFKKKSIVTQNILIFQRPPYITTFEWKKKKKKQAEYERVLQYYKCRLGVWFHFALQHTRMWKATDNTFAGNMQPL